ncbi:hypothetical protein TNCV_1653031 [Trichonephila clavipes]|nr:hypothetical protein TNCV_1653031 [Trichonephila clavipes]
MTKKLSNHDMQLNGNQEEKSTFMESTESSSGILLGQIYIILLDLAFYRSRVREDSRSELQAILRSNSQLTQDTIALINIVVATLITYTLQGIPAHIDIFFNEYADNLPKEARNSPQLSNSRTLTDADAIARRNLPSYPDLNCNRVISTTIVRLDTLKR